MRVAVVGAGPAGSTAALLLARAGARVSLFERAAWPRAKACGDGLTPTSVARLEALGVAVPGDRAFATTRVSGPRETTFRATWPPGARDGTTVPRVLFDDALVRAAIDAGVAFADRTEILACDAARVTTRDGSGATLTQTYDAVVLGEGGTGALGAACGLPPHRMRLIAYRGYVRTPRPLAPEYQVHYARAFNPGYAWIFPVAAQLANVGAVLVARGDVRARLRSWLACSAIARDQLGLAPELVDGRGGIIAIGRARRYADRVFAVGDAAGVADPLSAEGVSQAMESAALAADALIASGGNLARGGRAYERALRRFDANNREALRMRALFAYFADPLVDIAARRPRFARHVIAAGYFAKRDAAWFIGTLAALGPDEQRPVTGPGEGHGAVAKRDA